MNDWVFPVAFIATQVLGWLIARVVVRAVPSVARTRREWAAVNDRLSRTDRRRIERAVNRGQATDDPGLRSYAVHYAQGRLAMLGDAAPRRLWARALSIAVVLEFGVVAWLVFVRHEIVGGVILAGFVVLLAVVVLLAFQRRPGVLRRAIEANGGGHIAGQ